MSQNLKYTDEKRTHIKAEHEGRVLVVPVEPGNRHYDEMVAQGVTPAPFEPPRSRRGRSKGAKGQSGSRRRGLLGWPARLLGG